MHRAARFSTIALVSASLLGAGWSVGSAAVVINEIDYDQPGTDTAEFIELKNNGPGSVNLGTYSIELINGNAGGAVLYQTINLPNVTLAAGDYFVVCGDAANVPNCDLDVTPDVNLIQNGAPDAVGLRNSGVLVDAVSYEGNTGAPYTEGSGVGLEDNPAQAGIGISRLPDGTDTDVNNVDFKLRKITPGEPNLNVPATSPFVVGAVAAALLAAGAWFVARRRFRTA